MKKYKLQQDKRKKQRRSRKKLNWMRTMQFIRSKLTKKKVSVARNEAYEQMYQELHTSFLKYVLIFSKMDLTKG